MSLKHSNISIFVPHIGCPNKCSFCNQRYITGVNIAPNKSDVDNAVKEALKSKKYNPKTTEIAFFGGSFTAINRNYMLHLLDAAGEYVKQGLVKGIRISTRPDYIDDEILTILKNKYVTSIELGAQSLVDSVLKANNRGHDSACVYEASKLIRKHGFELGLQIMTGLYRDTYDGAVKTAEKVIEIKPDTVRIYPTIVLKNTYLAAIYSDGKYKPQRLYDAVDLASKLYCMFVENGINVIRLGLHSIEKDAFIAGPWHPAFSELCMSRIFLKKAINQLSKKGKYIIYTNSSNVSKMIGQKRYNINYLESLGYYCKVKINNELNSQEIIIEKEV